MSAKDIEGLWCDDITFCQEDCEDMGCPRNKHNIRDRRVPHSFSVDIPQDCPKKEAGYGMDIHNVSSDDPVLWKWARGGGVASAKCTGCGYEMRFLFMYEELHHFNYCPSCRRPVIWE